MRRKRNTGSRPIESRRARAWRKLKNGYQKAKAINWSDWIKALAAVAAVMLGAWTNHINQKSNETAKKLSDLQAAVVLKETEHKSEMVKLNNNVDDCKKQWQQQLKQIEEEAKKLPPSPLKRQILTLTKPQQSGRVVEPLRATETMPPIPERGN